MSQTRPDRRSRQSRLENLARQVAESHTVTRRPRHRRSLLDRLQVQEEWLRAGYQYFAQPSDVQFTPSYAAEWLLDNFYVAEQALRQIREHIPPKYYRQLPKLGVTPLEGYPRVYALALEIIRYCEGHLDLDQIMRFVQGYQTVRWLTVGELWALPMMLRLGILEILARATARITGIELKENKSFPQAISVSLPPDLDDDAVVANSILSLRMLVTQDWKQFFEDISRVEQILRDDPAGIYGRMDFDTRDRYRGVVEELALLSDWSGEDVAREAIRLAKGAQSTVDEPGSLRTGHVGFYLVDNGRAQLETRLDYRPSWRIQLSRWLLDHPSRLYLGLIALLTAIIVSGLMGYVAVIGGTPIQWIGVGLVIFFPVFSIAVTLVNWLITRTVPPRLLPRMDFREGIPAEYQTMVVVPALFSGPDEVQPLLQQLERHYLGNTDPHLRFALLADFADAPQRTMPGDEALLEQIEEGIKALNRQYGQRNVAPFYLFYREREWNPGEDCWMGWERKRGKLVAFNRLLRGRETSYTVQMGDLAFLPQIKYVITLDADTLLPRGEARRLVATLAHPLNHAKWDPDSGSVVTGYTVLQPRVEIKPGSAGRSLFAQIFSGDTGLDLYSRAVSDVYQDLFGEGIYAGKGIYDVDTFEKSLEGRVPDNTLLSHDLFEGIHGRAGLVSDLALYEEYPSHYLAYTRRKHRWVRGDWQLLPWLLPQVPHMSEGKIPNDLSILDRYKILDNLRRSFLSLVLLVLLLAGWLWLPGSPLVWMLLALLALTVPVLTGLIDGLIQRWHGEPLSGAVQAARLAILRGLVALIFLPYETLIIFDAIGSTLYRLIITRKRLLQWTTAAHTIRLFGRTTKLGLLWRQMGAASLLALGLTWLVVWIAPESLVVAAPLLFTWTLSPYVAHWISRPVVHKTVVLSEVKQQQLRRLARRTWLYFEQFVGPDDRWLPPDHFQEEPLGLVAHRTSPTNLGLMLLSTLGAYDLGYIDLLNLVLRLRPTFESMGSLERHRGHFLNWYDTRNFRPLPPRYVSTVDSGNLAGCLVALRQGLQTLHQAPIIRWQRWEGLLDTLDVLDEIVSGLDRRSLAAVRPLRDHLAHICQRVRAVKDDPSRWLPLLLEFGDRGWKELEQLLITLVEGGSTKLEAATLRDLRIWAERVSSQLLRMRGDVDILAPWLLLLDQPPVLFAETALPPALEDAWRKLVAFLPTRPRLGETVGICRAGRVHVDRLQRLLIDAFELDGENLLDDRAQAAHDWCARLSEALYASQMAVQSLLIGLEDLCAQAETGFQAMDFGFLFDRYRQVFHIGYNVETETLDGNYYDLLASEARIASLLAIAKGDVPQSHWLYLSRPVTRVNGLRALLSWGGTMFEYLMPPLLIHHYEGTLLEQSCHSAVAHQIDYGNQRGVPWGISESGYYRFDAGRHYQYRGFGVPGLGFKRGLKEDLVIAPYASLLALPFYPRAVARNIDRLVDLEMMGRYGFYEALDCTRSRMPAGQKSGIVRSYMVHHQGMALLALVNYLSENVMVRRFHADPYVQSIELLLHEQVPRRSPVEIPHPEEVRSAHRAKSPVAIAPWHEWMDTPIPQVNVLSNGHYSVLVTNTGGGVSCWRGVDLTRWRADTTLDDWGTWLYVQDDKSGQFWSAGYQPTSVLPESYEILFSAHKVEFSRRDHDISLRLEVTVLPDDDVEVRWVTLTNHSDHSRDLTLTSYGEVALAPNAADRRHPAFNKLFIHSEWLEDMDGLLFHRRLRFAEEEPVYMAHLVIAEREGEVATMVENDRARFLGRGQTARFPMALTGKGRGRLKGVGATLDPIMALGRKIELKPHAKTQVIYLTLAGKSRQEVLDLARRYRNLARIRRAFDRTHTRSESELRRLNLSTPEVECIQRLLSVLLYPNAVMRATPEVLSRNERGQSGLWAYGISGDFPILLVRVSDVEELELVRVLLQAHTYWRDRRIEIDLVILNERDTGYDQELGGRIHWLISQVGSDAWLGQRGGIFIVRADQMGESDRVLLLVSARAIVDGKNGSLSEQLRRLRRRPPRLPRFTPTLPGPAVVEPTPPLMRRDDLSFDNGWGGFSADGREYVIYLDRNSRTAQWTPAPWINVVAHSKFGFWVSEAGGGYTWAENSGENKLTPWRNDPVSDLPGEALYLRDEETAQVWSPTPLPAGAQVPYQICHGMGYSIFEHNSHGLKQHLRMFAVPESPVKVVQLRLENVWKRHRRITATFYVEWVLGPDRGSHQQYIIPEFDAISGALLARNPYNEEFAERVAFVTASKGLHGLTTDRAEFLGRGGSATHPAALGRIGLSGTVQAGLDPCAVLQVHIDLRPGEVEEIFFLLGQGENRQEALRLAERYGDAAEVEAAFEDVTSSWDRLLGTVTVRTPDPAMDLLLNRWLLYQALSCRIWGRSALYQSSGAFGYRDQLQDVMALLNAAPDVARDHILQAARHQFEAGDVLHWWHPPSGRGVRTRCSDDLLWLPFVTAHYVAVTGDDAVLDASVPFLSGEHLKPEEHDRYGKYGYAAQEGTLYEHCCRALEKGITAGPQGLPLIGSHDWNDGLSRVGLEGRGESVWLGWFLHATLTQFALLCDRSGDDDRAGAYRQQAADLLEALETNGWDGGWYRRATYDDGTPLGSLESDECQIDSIAQSWAVLSEAADPDRGVQAMAAVVDRLVNADDRLILLFTPPFDKTEHDPGYIKGYPPGIRENGGQYTHAALWTVWAFAKLGQGDRAEALFRLLNPIYHSDMPEKATRYRVEPYVVAADVYSVPPYTGRGGWTWYTGSAGWMYRLGLEAILGVYRDGKNLRIDPCIPRDWRGYELTYRFGKTHYRIRVGNPQGVNRGVKLVSLDTEILAEKAIPLLDDGQRHEVRVLMGKE